MGTRNNAKLSAAFAKAMSGEVPLCLRTAFCLALALLLLASCSNVGGKDESPAEDGGGYRYAKKVAARQGGEALGVPSKKGGLQSSEPELVQPGYTAVDDTRLCHILDENGEVIHTVNAGLCVFLEDGGMIGKVGEHLVMFDADGNIKWRKPIHVHHDISVYGNDIYFLTNEVRDFGGKKVRFDVIKRYSMEGEETYQWRTFEHLEYLMPFLSWGPALPPDEEAYKPGGDLAGYLARHEAHFVHEDGDPYLYEDSNHEFFHMNAIDVVPPTPISEKSEAFQEHKLLIDFPLYGFLAVLNPQTDSLEWTYYFDVITQVHSQSVLPSGNVLVYVNSTENDEKPYSSIVELNPLTKETVWEYIADPPGAFRQSFLGACERLPNGNTLVSDYTRGGRVFEVTPGKQIVWDWIHPEFDPEDGVPKGVYQSHRLPAGFAMKFVPKF